MQVRQSHNKECSDHASLAKLSIYPTTPLAYQVAEFVGHLCTRALPTKEGLKSAIQLAHDLVRHFANTPDN